VAPPWVKLKKSTISRLCKSNLESAQALPLPMPRVEQNVPQPKASRDQIVPQYQIAIFDAAIRFMETIVCTKNP
jgi:hypothetical protein